MALKHIFPIIDPATHLSLIPADSTEITRVLVLALIFIMY